MRPSVRCTRSLWLAAGIAVLSCSDSLGPPSSAGAPFLSATIQGAVWRVDTTDYLAADIGADSTVLIYGSELPPRYPRKIIALLLTRDSTGRYVLTDIRTGSWGGLASIPFGGATAQEFDTDSTHLGLAVLAVRDTVSHTLTGTFSFRAIDYASGSVAAVNDGRFRLHYSTAGP
jgi:hypothetical protein